MNTFQEEAQNMVSQIIQKFHPQKIIAFGSFARGDFNEDSDLDLCIIRENLPTLPIERKFQIYSLLEHRKIPVDVVMYQPEEFKKRVSLGDPFVKNILTQGKVLYG